MTCEHGSEYAQQLAFAVSPRHQDDLAWRASALSTWLDGAQLDGIEAELLEYGHHSHDDQRTHCGQLRAERQSDREELRAERERLRADYDARLADLRTALSAATKLDEDSAAAAEEQENS
ncbi:hypothetical protein [Saccharopolyspora pogona]|uniref:hypothetical protein n=1 Tax=Saccharopolyspora pogona TaxID=333966 RepID=UPI001CC23E29|nr:hypothetical protein [Saccharopolyspora pogona]